MKKKPRIGITMGDAAGVGPEIIVKAIASGQFSDSAELIVIGDQGRLRLAAKLTGHGDIELVDVTSDPSQPLNPEAINVVEVPGLDPEVEFGKISANAGEAAYRYLDAAVREAMAGKITAICTAPINKKALQDAGHIYAGHTELLADLTGTEEVSMMLQAPHLRVIHVTTHVGLKDAIARINPGLVERTIIRGHRALLAAGITTPTIAVCAINPHGGENGLFGEREEELKILPAIEAVQAAGINAVGPVPADTAFFRAVRGEFDLVVAMYHDQGHVPIKVMGIDAGVNITVGLPVVRTSVDHGTAFDIAGTGSADERGMIEAIIQAISLSPTNP